MLSLIHRMNWRKLSSSDILSNGPNIMSYFAPTFSKTPNNRSLRFWKQRYASKLSNWYL